MKLSRLITVSMTIVGTAAALRVLKKRHEWEKQNIKVAICVDYDDLASAAIRAGMSLEDLVERVADSGATHVSLPEYSLQSLLSKGRLTPQGPSAHLKGTPAVGHWNYLIGDQNLIAYLAEELYTRLPYTQAQVLKDGTLAFAGDLITIGEIGLGFDSTLANQLSGLGLVPRPVSYDWPEKKLLERTLSQAASLSSWVAFDGNMIIGHEMHLDETLAAMEKEGLRLVYFAESRHQKGDWFVAKRRAPHLVLAHQFTPEDMIPLDFHAAANNWAHFARERGIRFCYLNFFRVLHATAPLEGLSYIEHLKKALEQEGFIVSANPLPPSPIPTPQASDMAQVGTAIAGVATAAISQTLNLPETVAIPLAAIAAGAARSLPLLEKAQAKKPVSQGHSHHEHDHGHEHASDHPHEHKHHDHGHEHGGDNHHEHEHLDHNHGHDHEHAHPDLEQLYPASYTPKLLGLGTAALAPVITATLTRSQLSKSGWIANLIYQVGAVASLAAVTSGKDYQLRIEEYRGMNLDWLIPMAAATLNLPKASHRILALTGLAGIWGLAYRNNLDPLAKIDPSHPQGHTHHISAAQRVIGDTLMAVGPRPARKWAGLGPLASAVSIITSNKYPNFSTLASFLGVAGNMLGLVGFRRPERALQNTLMEALPSFGIGSGAGLLLLLIYRND